MSDVVSRADKPWLVVGRLLVVVAGVVVAAPLIWVLLGSFKSPADLDDPTTLLFSPTSSNWAEVVQSGIIGAAGRSLVVAVVTVLVSLAVGSLAAYSISRFKTGGDATRFGILAAQVLPPAVLVFPFLVVSYNLRLNDTMSRSSPRISASSCRWSAGSWSDSSTPSRSP